MGKCRSTELRVNEIIRRELATSLIHVGQGEGAEVMRISFVDVEVSRDLRGATVSCLDHGDAWSSRRAECAGCAATVEFPIAHRPGKCRLKYTPKLFFKQTSAIEKATGVLDILKEIVCRKRRRTWTRWGCRREFNGCLRGS